MSIYSNFKKLPLQVKWEDIKEGETLYLPSYLNQKGTKITVEYNYGEMMYVYYFNEDEYGYIYKDTIKHHLLVRPKQIY